MLAWAGLSFVAACNQGDDNRNAWSGEWWKYGGGGSFWDGLAYDDAAELVYVGTGNGLPWPQEIRQGKNSQRLDNLYVASIVAIDVNSGKLKWHFQCTPGDEWDFDAVQHLMLANIPIKGSNRKVIMQVNKNGYFYVLDRITGEFISGEPVAPISWSIGLDPTTGRPNINPEAFILPSAVPSWRRCKPTTHRRWLSIPTRDWSTFRSRPTTDSVSVQRRSFRSCPDSKLWVYATPEILPRRRRCPFLQPSDRSGPDNAASCPRGIRRLRKKCGLLQPVVRPEEA